MQALTRCLLVAAVVASVPATAQPVPIPDMAWGGAGDGIARVGFDLVSGGTDRAQAGIVLSDGRLVLAGSAQTAASSDAAFALLDAHSGLPDPGFGPNHDGRALVGIPDAQATDLAADASGKLLWVGNVYGTGATNVVIGRRLADGAPDTSFDLDGHRLVGPGAMLDGATVANFVRVLALPGGGVLALGIAIHEGDQVMRSCLMRYLADGSIDTDFGGGSGRVCPAPPATGIEALYLVDWLRLADGRMLLAGTAMHAGGSGFDMAVVRLSADGQADTNFGPLHDGWAYVGFDEGGTLEDVAYAIAVDAQGRVVLAGGFAGLAGSIDTGIVRLSAAGQLDTSFGVQGRVRIAVDPEGDNYDLAHSLTALPDGRLLVGGMVQLNRSVGWAARLEADGSLDPRFGTQGVFVQGDPAGPESALVDSARAVFAGDHLYMIGTSPNPVPPPGGGRNGDFAATRFVIPLFNDDFEAF